MSRVLSCWIAACLGALPVAALAQSMSMQDMPGMSMPAPHDDHGSTTPPDDAQHAGHDMAVSALPPNDHVPPSPPQTVLHAMSPSQMNAMMQMDDNESIGMLLVDRLERSRSTSGDMATSWEAEGIHVKSSQNQVHQLRLNDAFTLSQSRAVHALIAHSLYR